MLENQSGWRSLAKKQRSKDLDAGIEKVCHTGNTGGCSPKPAVRWELLKIAAGPLVQKVIATASDPFIAVVGKKKVQNWDKNPQKNADKKRSSRATRGTSKSTELCVTRDVKCWEFQYTPTIN